MRIQLDLAVYVYFQGKSMPVLMKGIYQPYLRYCVAMSSAAGVESDLMPQGPPWELHHRQVPLAVLSDRTSPGSAVEYEMPSAAIIITARGGLTPSLLFRLSPSCHFIASVNASRGLRTYGLGLLSGIRGLGFNRSDWAGSVSSLNICPRCWAYYFLWMKCFWAWSSIFSIQHVKVGSKHFRPL